MRALLFLLIAVCLPLPAQVSLRVNGAAPATVSAESLAKLPRHSVTLNDHGKQAAYEGVLLHDVLAANGVDFGKGLHGKQLASYVAVIGKDGYEVVFGIGDLDPTISDAELLIADKRNAESLSATEGPLRLVASHDKRPARSVRMLQEIDVVQASKP